MLEEILTALHNWFPAGGYPVRAEQRTYTVAAGAFSPEGVAPGQYYRVRGSAFNDGLHRHPAADLTDETFTGEVWPLAIPRAVLRLADDVTAWQAKNPATDKTSESFGGYSYTRGAERGWQAAFAGRLAPYRRMSEDD